MATETIGTDSRDHIDIGTWNAALGTGSQTGECYDDSPFDETVTINDTDPDDITLTVAAGERGDGTEGTGARNVRTGSGDVLTVQVFPTTIEWLEIDMNGQTPSNGAIHLTHDTATAEQVFIQRMLIHGGDATGGNWCAGIYGTSNAGGVVVQNNFIYDFVHSGNSNRDAFGIRVGTAREFDVLNDTILHIFHDHATDGEAYGIQNFDDSNQSYKNNVVADVTNDSAATAVCFAVDTSTNSDDATNASDDSTGPNQFAGNPIAAGTEFTSTVGGSEDLHLKTGAECFEAGTDLGTSPTGVEVDVNGYDRDAGATTWSIGGDDGNSLRGGTALSPGSLSLLGVGI